MARPRGRQPRILSGFVLDNSIVMAWSFADESSDYADAVLDGLTASRAIVPALWPLEVANALLMGERRKRSTEAETIRWIGILNRLPIDIDDATNARAWSDTLAVARGHKLSTYDAAYLELAMRRGRPLATLDKPLKAAAIAVGVRRIAKFPWRGKRGLAPAVLGRCLSPFPGRVGTRERLCNPPAVGVALCDPSDKPG